MPWQQNDPNSSFTDWLSLVLSAACHGLHKLMDGLRLQLSWCDLTVELQSCSSRWSCSGIRREWSTRWPLTSSQWMRSPYRFTDGACVKCDVMVMSSVLLRTPFHLMRPQVITWLKCLTGVTWWQLELTVFIDRWRQWKEAERSRKSFEFRLLCLSAEGKVCNILTMSNISQWRFSGPFIRHVPQLCSSPNQPVENTVAATGMSSLTSLADSSSQAWIIQHLWWARIYRVCPLPPMSGGMRVL